MKYEYIIYDIDDTLIDYEETEHMVLHHIFRDSGMELDEEMFQRCFRWSWEYWDKQGMSDGKNPETQTNYHEWYHTYLDIYFAKLKKEFGLVQDVDGLHHSFLNYMGQARSLQPEAVEVYEQLADSCQLVLATNGLAEVQRQRTGGLMAHFSDIFISEELGTIKPSPIFFKKMLCKLETAADKCLMVGDSLTSDILGANRVGMDCCWFNPSKRENRSEAVPTYEITKWKDLLLIVQGGVYENCDHQCQFTEAKKCTAI